MMVPKAVVGHTLGGCVLVETVASLLALRRGEIPAIVRCDEPDPSLNIGRPKSQTFPENWVLLKCTNGFAGQNGAFVLRSPGA